MQPRLALIATFAVACSGTTDDTIKIDSIVPNFAPLSGGTRVVIRGQGFLRSGATPDRVLIGGVEAPQAGAVDDSNLEVDVPPGVMPGDVPVVVFNRNGTATAMGQFHYSTPPAVMSVTPADVLYSSNAMMTVTGSGFKDEEAGPPKVIVNGKPGLDVQITSDTQLTFTSPVDDPLVRPVVTVINARGTVSKKAAYRYTPSANPTLVLFANANPNTYVIYFDTVTSSVLAIPNRNAAQTGYRAVVRDANGDYWAVHNNAGNSGKFGKIDFGLQEVENPIQLANQINALARMDASIYAVDRSSGAFGKFDLTSGSFSQISVGQTPSVHASLSASSTTLFFANSQGIATLNPTTGARGTVTPLSVAHNFGEMRFVGTKLYSVDDRSGDIFTIDPATGTVATITNVGTRLSSFEVFNPGPAQ